MTTTNKILVGAAIVGLIYGVSLINWGKQVGSKVSLKVLKARNVKITGWDWKKPLASIRDAKLEMFIDLGIDNKNAFPITLDDLTGTVFYGLDKIAEIENKDAVEFIAGKTVYSVKVSTTLGAEALTFGKMILSKDLIRALRFVGSYTATVQDTTYPPVPFDEKMSVMDY